MRNNKGNSWNSSAISEEIFNTFQDSKINAINKIETNINEIIKKFKSRFPNKIKNISDLSINKRFYFPERYNDDIDNDPSIPLYKK